MTLRPGAVAGPRRGRPVRSAIPPTARHPGASAGGPFPLLSRHPRPPRRPGSGDTGRGRPSPGGFIAPGSRRRGPALRWVPVGCLLSGLTDPPSLPGPWLEFPRLRFWNPKCDSNHLPTVVERGTLVTMRAARSLPSTYGRCNWCSSGAGGALDRKPPRFAGCSRREARTDYPQAAFLAIPPGSWRSRIPDFRTRLLGGTNNAISHNNQHVCVFVTVLCLFGVFA
jgi:hypothetical protein